MAAQRFFLKHIDPQSGAIQFPPDIAHQIAHVLRMETGDLVTVLDGEGKAYQVELSEVGGDQVKAKIVQVGETEVHLPVRIKLFFPLSRREKVEWILQKGTEVGVSILQPYISARSLVQDVSLPAKKRQRWESIIREAAEQSGRAFLPQLLAPQTLSNTLKSGLDDFDAVLVASVPEKDAALSSVLDQMKLNPEAALGLYVGAEGGFSDQELSAFQKRGIRAVSLGQTVLRMETAAIVFPALILHHLSDRFRLE